MVLRTYDSALEYLYGCHRAASASPRTTPDTSRVLLERLGICRVVASDYIAHITGTNGKGSTCAYIELFCRSMGSDTVVLTSPHANSVRERIRWNGAMISKDVFVELMNEVAPAMEALRGTELQPSPMTVMSVLALQLHERLGTHCRGIYEVGVGGAHDSTNVFERAYVGLTKVDADHVDQFGGSLIGVLIEKLGLCRRGGTLVHSQQDPLLEQVLKCYCREMNVVPSSVEAGAIVRLSRTLGNALLPGPWQAENAALAYELFKRIDRDAPSLHDLNLRINQRRVNHPGRLQDRIVLDRRVTLDGAHNAPAIARLLAHLRGFPAAAGCVAVLGFSAGKQWQNMLDQVVSTTLFSTLVFTRSTRPRCIEPELPAAYAAARSHIPIVALPSLASALRWVLQKTTGPILVTGSLLVVGDFDRALHALGLHEWAVPAEDIDPAQPWMNEL